MGVERCAAIDVLAIGAVLVEGKLLHLMLREREQAVEADVLDRWVAGVQPQVLEDSSTVLAKHSVHR